MLNATFIVKVEFNEMAANQVYCLIILRFSAQVFYLKCGLYRGVIGRKKMSYQFSVFAK
jgi:hypothetical protein